VAALVALPVGWAGAADWYVARDAAGSNTGASWTDAWTSLSKIHWPAVQPGDTIEISGGTTAKVYYGRCRVEKSGKAGNLITIRGSSAPGHSGTVIIDGRDRTTTDAGGLGPWTQHAGNVWCTTLSFAPGYVGQPGVNVRFASPIQDGVKLDYYMVASADECKAPGNWFIHDVNGSAPYTLYVYCYDLGAKGHNPLNYTITMPRHMNCFNLQGGRSYISIEKMTLRYSTDNGVACGNTVGCEFRGLSVYGHRVTGIYFLDNGNANNLVEGCSFANNGHCGIEFTADRDSTVRGCRFYTTGPVREGNSTHIAFPSTGGAKSDITIENCLFEKNGSNYGKLEHGIAIFNTSVDNLVIRHNTFCSWNQNGFLCTSGAGNYTIANNVFYATDSWRFLAFGGHMGATPTATLNLTNNVFYGTTTYGGYRWGATDYSSFSDFKTHVEGNGGTVSGNLFQDPQLADVSAYDLRLTASSPRIDAAPDAGTNDSYDGTVRPVGSGYDVGAYESTGRAPN